MTELFASHAATNNVILLVDASGSVVMSKYNNVLVLDQIKKIIKELPENKYRIIFWNSDKNAPQFFKNGFCKLPFIVEKDKLDQTFTFVQKNITENCLTFPHVAFDNISEEWISKTDITKIYFITDGEMGYGNITPLEKRSLESALSDSIKRLFKLYSNVQLTIITVEPKNMDFTQMETMQRAAGSDVYNVIMNNNLTKYVAKFVSYTPNNPNGFVHISKNIPPPGFLPYGEKYFSELRIGEFIKYLVDEISHTNNENDLLQIVQNLSSTLCKLTKDKPKNIVNQIVRTFCGLFAGTTLDMMFVQFILDDAIEKENAGMANIFAMYRSKLRDLYKQATDLLQKNVKDAIGINESFMTLPIDNIIISGHFRLIDKNITVEKITYPQSSLIINNIMVPILPTACKNISPMNEQCLRQWVRVLIHKMYNVNALEDIVIYIVLSLVLKISLSDCPDEIKTSYRKLGTIMLKKKRMNTDTTELERLENGELPTPNSGKIEVFYGYMDAINKILGLQLAPMTLWYMFCLALDNKSLINKQLIHCKDSLEKDFPGQDSNSLLIALKEKLDPKQYTIVYHKIPFENVLDYSCPITMEDTSFNGGYRFLEHQNMIGVVCCPVYVLSEDGYKQLLQNKQTCVCPICYTDLDEKHFQKVEKKPASLAELNIFPPETKNLFGKDTPIHVSKIFTGTSINNVSNVINVTNATNATNVSTRNSVIPNNKINKKGTLIIMKGTVGAGKSTYSQKLRKEIEKIGGRCFVEGTDKYCKQGIPIGQAVIKVREELLNINTLPDDNKLLVVVIDTCGEKNNGSSVFDIDFTGWNKINVWPNLNRSDLHGYLVWSLRNVLQRNIPEYTDIHWLNPIEAGVTQCINVHRKKAQALFGKKMTNIWSLPINRDEAIKVLNTKADEYQTYLDSNINMDNEISNLISKKILKS